MNGECIERGEIRLILMSGARVPAVVVSSNEYNAKFQKVVVVGITQKDGAPDFRVRIDEGETHGYIAIDNPLGVRPLSLGRRVGKVPRATMDRVDDLLETLFDMGYEDDSRLKEINDLKAENERLKREVAYGKEGIFARAAEIKKYQKLYEKAVDQIADMTLAADVAKRIAEKTAVVEEPVSAEVVEEEVVDPVEEFETVEEEIPEEPPVVEKPQPKMTFPTWEPPVEKPTEKKPVKKVNVNEATQNELMGLGFSKSSAGRIVSHVKLYGPYKKVEDLKGVDGVPSKLIRKLKDILEV